MSDTGRLNVGQLRLLWLIGDWPALAQLTMAALETHPDRAALVLMAIAGCQQTGNCDDVAGLIDLAVRWGCSRRQVSEILISGVHCSLGRACAALGDEDRSMYHYRLSISTAPGGIDSTELAQARAAHQALMA